MPSFASPADLRRLPPGVVSASISDVDADAALERATNAIIAELGWPVWEHTATVRVYDHTVVLPALHVTAVSVTVNAVALLPAEFRWKPSGIVDLLIPYYWAPTTPAVLVTYTAGYVAVLDPSPAPGDPPETLLPRVIKDVCVKLAAEELSGTASNLRSKSWTVGNESETESYDTATGGYSLATDRRLDAYRMTAAVA